jgi:hypothetical protein
MGLKQLGWSLGLTKEKRTELSDVLYETASVTAKDYQEKEDGLLTGMAMGNLAMGMLFEKDEKFSVSFKGQKTSFDINNEKIFKSLKIGDRVRLSYQEKYKSTYDYIPPNFDQKQQLDKVLSGYKFVSAEKIE